MCNKKKRGESVAAVKERVLEGKIANHSQQPQDRIDLVHTCPEVVWNHVWTIHPMGCLESIQDHRYKA